MDDLKQYVDNHTHSARDKAAFTFSFGKYQGRHVLEVYQYDPQYLKYIWQTAKYRMSPEISGFIIDNATHIREAIKLQDLKEKDLF